MSYISINEYSRKWIFTHQSMPVPEADLELIKPMSQARAAQLWKEQVSATSPDAARFSSQDWPMKDSNWSESISWMSEWESDEIDLPEALTQHIDWQDDVTIYFCYEKYNVLETKWAVFKKHWKNFLFYDDGPILIGKKRDQALWFQEDGTVKLGKRR
ncbi:DUF2947 family protein [Vibrio astriarenae]|uniref:DUF2947 family protein n=1 Tax=Vibrio astriarenae TaxID=1481923 RepID=A0A7Z2T2I8_9VIBR|nr:DUF2947 domain-containing protein [Vibrio astriarenae]QIA62978.1 DUF2947 family protein [Vibrio astriarenae]